MFSLNVLQHVELSTSLPLFISENFPHDSGLPDR